MALSKRDVEHIAHLARLEVSDDEIADYVEKLSRIVDLFTQLRQADTTGVAPMAHPLDMRQRLRPDDITEADHRDRFQKNATAVEHGLYKVPRVIE